MRFKDLYDQDKDGKLNREEQLRWVAPNSYGSAREEVSLQCSNMCLDFVWITCNFLMLIKQINVNLKEMNEFLFLSFTSLPWPVLIRSDLRRNPDHL